MSIENTRYAVVNLSTTKIPVYEKLVHSSVHTGSVTVGGNVIGHIHQYEFYTVIPNDSNYITSHKIMFLDGNNKVVYGYIETLPATTYPEYAWNKLQEPYYFYNSNGSKLVASTKVTISGGTYRVFTVKREVSYKKPTDIGTNVYSGKLAVGTKIATNSVTVGQDNPGCMIFQYKQNSNGTWSQIHSGQSYVFVNLDMGLGAMPDNRAIW